jgi:GDP-L-fucose synthase
MTIVVAGGTGLAGSAIVRAYVAAGHEVIPVNRKVVDLLDRDATFDFIASVNPTLVIDAAAKVGGIGANNSYPVEFLADNRASKTSSSLEILMLCATGDMQKSMWNQCG